jgi:hypothetical protein
MDSSEMKWIGINLVILAIGMAQIILNLVGLTNTDIGMKRRRRCIIEVEI